MQLQDLARIYEAKTDEELLLIADAVKDLIPEAEMALHSELSRRGLGSQVSASVVSNPSIREERLEPALSNVGDALSVSEFVGLVAHTYRDNFWIFAKLMAPSVIFGYLVLMFCADEVRAILQHAFQTGGVAALRANIFKIGLINISGTFANCLFIFLSFAGICMAVAHLEAGDDPSFGDYFVKVFQRPGAFLRLSAILMGLVLMSIGLISVAIAFSSAILRVHWTPLFNLVVSLVLATLAFLVLSRFGLAIPAFIIDDNKVGQSIFRSDELTQGKWTILAILVTKATVGGYVAGMLPFWIAARAWSFGHPPSWLLTIASIAGVIAVEPYIFIGFSLLYLRSAKAKIRTVPNV